MTTTTLRKVFIWVVVVVLAVLLVASLVGRESRQAAAGNPQPVPSPSLTTTDTPSMAPAASASPKAHGNDSSLNDRILAFEQAYRQLDPSVRREALQPFTTDKFLQELLPSDSQESAYMKSLREGVTSTLDLDTAIVNAEELDDNTLEVFTQITKTTTSDGESQTMALTHVTFWVQDKTGTWRVDAESIT